VKRSLLDTDIASEIFKEVNQTVVARAAEYLSQYDRYTLPTITVVEVVRGLHYVGREERVQQFIGLLRAVELLSLDIHSAELAGRIQADLQRTRQPIGWADPLIAAIALRHDLMLVTGNTAHYRRIQDLRHPLQLDNWRLL
jgi:tRNA(fMet)-specific endonuclease VapC